MDVDFDKRSNDCTCMRTGKKKRNEKKHTHTSRIQFTQEKMNNNLFFNWNPKIGHDWGFYIMVTDLPKYMSAVLKFPIKDNGIYSSLPYLVMWVVSVSTGFLSDYLIVRKCVTITGARKWFTGVGEYWKCVLIFKISLNSWQFNFIILFFILFFF